MNPFVRALGNRTIACATRGVRPFICGPRLRRVSRPADVPEREFDIPPNYCPTDPPSEATTKLSERGVCQAPLRKPAWQLLADRPTNYSLYSPSGNRLRSRTPA